MPLPYCHTPPSHHMQTGQLSGEGEREEKEQRREGGTGKDEG